MYQLTFLTRTLGWYISGFTNDNQEISMENVLIYQKMPVRVLSVFL